MKRIVLCFFTLLISFGSLFSQESPKATYSFSIDPFLSPYVGGQDLLTVYKSLLFAEDFVFRNKEPKTGFWISNARLLELALLWGPLSSAAATVQHEVFGHGYRARANPYTDVKKYKIYYPFPYGRGGGYTKYSFGDDYTVSDDLATTVAGLEAEEILARQLKEKMCRSRCVDGRIAGLYIGSSLSSLTYTLITEKDEDQQESDGNDIANYLKELNALYRWDPLSVTQLKRQLLFNFLDPMLYYSLYSQAKYILTGKSFKPLLFKIGHLEFLPNIRVGLAPYGLETYLEGLFFYEDASGYAYVKAGKTKGIDYYGAGVHLDDLLQFENMFFGIRLDTWYQPKYMAFWPLSVYLKDGPRPSIDGQIVTRNIGIAGSIIGKFRVTKKSPFFWETEVGYKSRGYVPGLNVRAFPILRLGVVSPF